MFKLHKNMNEEIKKYQGRIYYFDKISKKIYPANWIQTINDYNHYEYELHHVVPFTDWEKNTRNVQSLMNNALILIPKVMHQHLENPEYRLSKKKFEEIYKINPDIILFDINSKLPRTAELFTKNDKGAFSFALSDDDLSCFDEINSDCNQILGLNIENLLIDDCGVCCV